MAVCAASSKAAARAGRERMQPLTLPSTGEIVASGRPAHVMLPMRAARPSEPPGRRGIGDRLYSQAAGNWIVTARTTMWGMASARASNAQRGAHKSPVVKDVQALGANGRSLDAIWNWP